MSYYSDTALHKASAKDIDIAQFEVDELQRLGMPEGIIMRHRPAHFQRKPVTFTEQPAYLFSCMPLCRPLFRRQLCGSLLCVSVGGSS